MKAPFAFLQHSKSTRSQVATFLNWISIFSPIDTNRVFSGKKCDLQFWLKIYLTATSEAIHLQLSAAAASRRRRSEKLFLFPENNENKLNRVEVGKMSFNVEMAFSERKCSCKEKRSWGVGPQRTMDIILTSYPATPGSIPGIPKNFSELLMLLRLINGTAA